MSESADPAGSRSRRPRWWFYSAELAPVGTHGPFGPIQADDEPTARRIAVARARRSGLTVARVESSDAASSDERGRQL